MREDFSADANQAAVRYGLIRVQHHQFTLAEAAVIPARQQAEVFPRRQRGWGRPACLPAERFHQVVELAVERSGVGYIFIERKRRGAANLARP